VRELFERGYEARYVRRWGAVLTSGTDSNDENWIREASIENTCRVELQRIVSRLVNNQSIQVYYEECCSAPPRRLVLAAGELLARAPLFALTGSIRIRSAVNRSWDGILLVPSEAELRLIAELQGPYEEVGSERDSVADIDVFGAEPGIVANSASRPKKASSELTSSLMEKLVSRWNEFKAKHGRAANRKIVASWIKELDPRPKHRADLAQQFIKKQSDRNYPGRPRKSKIRSAKTRQTF
jgi:hypothetical protein